MAARTFGDAIPPTSTLLAETVIRQADLAAAIERSRDLCWWGRQLCARTDPHRRSIRGGSIDDAGLVVTMITGVSFCPDCIAKRIGVPVSRVDALLMTITGNIALVVETRRCDACLETKRTYQLAADASRADAHVMTRSGGTRQAIRHFLGQRPGTALCTDCITVKLFAGKNIDVAMRVLEGNGVQRRNARCSGCGKLRLVAGVQLSS